jgi:hypothetical protein
MSNSPVKGSPRITPNIQALNRVRECRAGLEVFLTDPNVPIDTTRFVSWASNGATAAILPKLDSIQHRGIETERDYWANA